MASDAEALRPVEARDRVLARPPRRAPVPHDPDRMGLLPLAHAGRFYFVPQSGQRRVRIGSRRHGPSHDEQVGARGEGLPRGRDALLIDRLRAGRPNSRARPSETPARRRRGSPGRSAGEQTTPSSPQSLASTARRRAMPSGGPAIGRSASAFASIDVSSVTATRRGRPGLPASALRAASSIARPPDACTFRSDAPERAGGGDRAATVLGMSWNFRSRNTFALCATSATSAGPLRDEGLEADLEPADLRAEAARRREDLRPVRKVERDAELLGAAHPSAPASTSGALRRERAPDERRRRRRRARRSSASSSATRRAEIPGSRKLAVPT